MVYIRFLRLGDFEKGFIETLSALTDVDLEDQDSLADILSQRNKSGVKTFVAIEDGQVVGTASFFVEQKFLHGGGKVAHVEDVAVRQDRHRTGIGSALMNYIEQEVKLEGCYKIILDCSQHNEDFYSTLGYYRHESQMRKNI